MCDPRSPLQHGLSGVFFSLAADHGKGPWMVVVNNLLVIPCGDRLTFAITY